MFSPTIDMIISEKLTRESADADVSFVASWLSNSHVFNLSHSSQCWFLTNIAWNRPSGKCGARKTSRVSRKKTSFSLVQKMFCTRRKRRPYAPWVFWNWGECQHPSPTFHRCDQVVCLRWCLRQTISQTILSRNVCKVMNIPWTSFLSQHGYHVNLSPFGSGK